MPMAALLGISSVESGEVIFSLAFGNMYLQVFDVVVITCVELVTRNCTLSRYVVPEVCWLVYGATATGDDETAVFVRSFA